MFIVVSDSWWDLLDLQGFLISATKILPKILTASWAVYGPRVIIYNREATFGA